MGYVLGTIWAAIWCPWAATLAWRRGRNEKVWIAVSLLLGPLAIVALHVLPRLPRGERTRPSALDRLEKAPKQWRG